MLINTAAKIPPRKGLSRGLQKGIVKNQKKETLPLEIRVRLTRMTVVSEKLPHCTGEMATLLAFWDEQSTLCSPQADF